MSRKKARFGTAYGIPRLFSPSLALPSLFSLLSLNESEQNRPIQIKRDKSRTSEMNSSEFTRRN